MTDVLQDRNKSLVSKNTEMGKLSAILGWRGLLRLLIYFNILGLLGLSISAARSAEVGSELLLAPLAAFAGEKTSEKIAPVAAPLLATQIKTTITGHIVRTTVTQNFTNPTNNWMEGMYYFPLPDDAAVDHMVLKIGDRLIVSEIQEKNQAKQTYLKAAAAGKVSALLTQYRPNVFSTRLANIEPMGTVSVEISFQGLARLSGTEFIWRMPQAITPRYVPEPANAIAQGPSVQKTTVTHFPREKFPGDAHYDPSRKSNPSSFDIRIKQASKLALIKSPSHSIDTYDTGDDERRVRLSKGAVPAERDFILKWQYAQGVEPTILLFEEQDETAAYTLGLLLPPVADKQVQDIKRDVTFILDISGSMFGTAMEQGRAALLTALDLLKEGDRFDVIAFNSQYERLFGRSEPVTSENIEAAKDFVLDLVANNGTDMYPALNSALDDIQPEGFQRQILFLTDGAVGNEQEMFELVNEKLGPARLFTVGVGNAPNGWFMRKGAEFGRGIHIQISDLKNVRFELEELFEDMASPTLEKINVAFGDVSDIYPKIIPDLFGQRPMVFVARHAPNVAEASVTAQLPFGSRLEIPLSVSDHAKQAGIAKLWAAKKVEGLTDALARGMDEDIVRTAVLDVALRHQIMSRYTSFVAVDKTPVRIKDNFLKKTKVKGNLPAGLSWQKIQGLQTATSMELSTLIGSLALMLALMLYFSRRKDG